MTLTESVERFFSDRQIRPRHLLAAVSGGPDSTALLLALHEWDGRPFELSAAHVNHHLRGEESNEDEAFVAELCSRRGVPLLSLEGDLDSATIRMSGVEAAARESRYAALRAAREARGIDWIATGHQQSDQAETLLIRLMTGTGPGRLGGIPPVTKDRIARPLLGVPREDIERFLADRGITPRKDRMNRDPRFLRTRVREELIPLLEEFNPRIIQALAETARQTREQQESIRWLIGAAADRWVERSPGASRISVDLLPDIGWIRRAVLLREILRLEPGAREVSAEDLERLARSLPSLRRTSVTGTLEILREGESVVLRRTLPPTPPFEIELRVGKRRRLPGGATFRIERFPAAPAEFRAGGPGLQRFQLPPDASARTFLVRNRRRGDRLVPLGSSHEKKLNELLIDRKIPRERRDRIPLLVWNGEIVWVPGVEVSDRFKVSEPWRETFEASVETDDE